MRHRVKLWLGISNTLVLMSHHVIEHVQQCFFNLSVSRCRHAAIAEYFGDPQPKVQTCKGKMP